MVSPCVFQASGILTLNAHAGLVGGPPLPLRKTSSRTTIRIVKPNEPLPQLEQPERQSRNETPTPNVPVRRAMCEGSKLTG